MSFIVVANAFSGSSAGRDRNPFAAALSGLGGLLGAFLGSAVTYVFARRQNFVFDVPVQVLGAGVGAALVIGVLAGFYPAAKAARLDPASAASVGK